MQEEGDEYNYLGLEIRPGVAQVAQERIEKYGLTGRLDFVGCNANVDLDRLLRLYKDVAGGMVQRVSVQFPDPHFKAAHAKRRVVTPKLVDTLARYMPPQGQVLLQSDVQFVLDDMRERFRESERYFCDTIESKEEYVAENVLGVQTEREISVLSQDLPVYRATLFRTSNAYETGDV
jgi:tRNA (guanine-N7-)-methyltransferase